MKVASTVREGAVGKALSLRGRSLAAYFTDPAGAGSSPSGPIRWRVAQR